MGAGQGWYRAPGAAHTGSVRLCRRCCESAAKQGCAGLRRPVCCIRDCETLVAAVATMPVAVAAVPPAATAAVACVQQANRAPPSCGVTLQAAGSSCRLLVVESVGWDHPCCGAHCDAHTCAWLRTAPGIWLGPPYTRWGLPGLRPCSVGQQCEVTHALTHAAVGCCWCPVCEVLVAHLQWTHSGRRLLWLGCWGRTRECLESRTKRGCRQGLPMPATGVGGWDERCVT